MGKKGQVNCGLDRSCISRMATQRGAVNLSCSQRESLLLAFLAIFVFLIYSNCLQAPFTFDDLNNIKENPFIRLTQLTFEGVHRATFDTSTGYVPTHRPVAFFSFALNYYFHQYHMFGYHLVNIFIHILTGIFLYLFIKSTLGLASLRSSYSPHSWLPFIAVLIWLVHPVQTQAVTYIVQRMASMAAMFYILSFYLYVRARLEEEFGKRWALFAGCGLAGLLSLGCKEIAVTLPFFIVLYEWYFLQDLSWRWLKRRVPLFLGLFILLVLVVFAYLGANPLDAILKPYELRDFTLTERVLTEFRVVIFYISLLLFPHPSRLNLDHDFLISHSLLDPVTTLFSVSAIMGLVGLAVYLARRERLFSFCILWFFGNLVIESSVLGLELVFEHRMYLPSMLVSVLAVALYCRYMKSIRWGIAVSCTVVLVFSSWTYQRNAIWSDSVALWRDVVQKSPNKSRPHNNLGMILIEAGKIEEAIVHCREAIKLNPDFADAHSSLAWGLHLSGKIEEGITHSREAIRINPLHADAHNNLVYGLLLSGEIEEGITHCREAIRINPLSADYHGTCGYAFFTQGEYDNAISHFLEVLRIDPLNVKGHNNLGAALMEKGEIDKGIHYFQEALRIKPGDASAINNLQLAKTKQDSGKKLYTMPQIPELKSHLKSADPAQHYQLGNKYKSEGNLDKAIDQYQKALSIQPGFMPALNHLALTYISQEAYDKAMPLYMQMIEHRPDSYVAYYNMACLHAQQNNTQESLNWLKGAVLRGFSDWTFLKDDNDLKNIRDTAYFKELTRPVK